MPQHDESKGRKEREHNCAGDRVRWHRKLISGGGERGFYFQICPYLPRSSCGRSQVKWEVLSEEVAHFSGESCNMSRSTPCSCYYESLKK